MAGTDLDYPLVVFVRRNDATGYGFTFNSHEDFEASAEAFLKPIDVTIEKKFATDEEAKENLTPEILHRRAASSFMGQIFERTMEENMTTDGIRWIAAACVKMHQWKGEIPKACMIEYVNSDVDVHAADEFLTQDPGHPMAIIVGRKTEGGGIATFYDTPALYKKKATQPPSEKSWLPQILYRLYQRTPNIMLGIPTPSKDGSGKLGVEFQALDLSTKGKLVERPIGG